MFIKGLGGKPPREICTLGSTLCIDSKSKIHTYKKDTLHISADNLKYERHCKFSKSHSSEHEDNHLLACDVVQSLIFQRNCVICTGNRNRFL